MFILNGETGDTADALMRKIVNPSSSDNPVQCWVIATYKKENRHNRTPGS